MQAPARSGLCNIVKGSDPFTSATMRANTSAGEARAFVPTGRKLGLLLAAAFPARPPRQLIDVPRLPVLADAPPLPDLGPALTDDFAARGVS